MAYYSIEPWGEEPADLRSGIVASTIANANRGKNQRAYKPGDFMPKWGGDEGGKTMSAREIERTLDGFVKGQQNRRAQ